MVVNECLDFFWDRTSYQLYTNHPTKYVHQKMCMYHQSKNMCDQYPKICNSDILSYVNCIFTENIVSSVLVVTIDLDCRNLLRKCTRWCHLCAWERIQLRCVSAGSGIAETQHPRILHVSPCFSRVFCLKLIIALCRDFVVEHVLEYQAHFLFRCDHSRHAALWCWKLSDHRFCSFLGSRCRNDATQFNESMENQIGSHWNCRRSTPKLNCQWCVAGFVGESQGVLLVPHCDFAIMIWCIHCCCDIPCSKKWWHLCSHFS